MLRMFKVHLSSTHGVTQREISLFEIYSRVSVRVKIASELYRIVDTSATYSTDVHSVASLHDDSGLGSGFVLLLVEQFRVDDATQRCTFYKLDIVAFLSRKPHIDRSRSLACIIAECMARAHPLEN